MTETKTLTIGSVDEAETAWLQHAYGQVLDAWQYLGSGIDRHAYLSPSKVVYKIPTARYGAMDAQWKEMEGYRILSSGPAHDRFSVPVTDLTTVAGSCPVIVMEYIEGQGYYLEGAELAEAQRFFRNTDTHGGNLIKRMSDGRIFMIDLGFFSEDGVSSEDNDCSCCRPCGYCGDAGCNAACMICNKCEMRECECCDICGDVDCFCCNKCREAEGNCCCDFCTNCTAHIDDCCGECK